MIASDVLLGKNVIICEGAVLTVNIKIGNHVVININATVGHDAVLEDYASLMPGVHISGYDLLKEGCYLGTGSSVIQNVVVGCWSKIGAGAVVISDIADNSVAVGVPAKVIKKVER